MEEWLATTLLFCMLPINHIIPSGVSPQFMDYLVPYLLETDISWLQEEWVIANPVDDIKKREILFITAQCAGMKVGTSTLAHEDDRDYPYICLRIFIINKSVTTLITGVKKPYEEKKVSYAQVMNAMRLKIKQL